MGGKPKKGFFFVNTAKKKFPRVKKWFWVPTQNQTSSPKFQDPTPPPPPPPQGGGPPFSHPQKTTHPPPNKKNPKTTPTQTKVHQTKRGCPKKKKNEDPQRAKKKKKKKNLWLSKHQKIKKNAKASHKNICLGSNPPESPDDNFQKKACNIGIDLFLLVFFVWFSTRNKTPNQICWTTGWTPPHETVKTRNKKGLFWGGVLFVLNWVGGGLGKKKQGLPTHNKNRPRVGGWWGGL